MKKLILILLIILTSVQAEAQLFKQKSIDATIGFGISSPYDDIDVAGTGLYLQGEYILEYSKWFDLRPYAGLILTRSRGKDLNENPTPYKSTSNAVLIGGKARLTFPIPWVAPYFELGFGASIGHFENLSPTVNIDKSGIIYHIPFTVGLELGPNRNINIAFTYCVQPTVEQFVGALAVGISIPINKNK